MGKEQQAGLDWIRAAEPLLAGLGFFFLLVVAIFVLAMLGASALELKPAGFAYSVLVLYVLGMSGIVSGLPMSLNKYVGSWEFRREQGGIVMEETVQRIFGTTVLNLKFAEGASATLERVIAIDVPLWRPLIADTSREVIHAFPVAFPKPVANKMVAQLSLFLSGKAQNQCVLEHAYATDRTRLLGRVILLVGVSLMLVGAAASRLSGTQNASRHAAVRAEKTKTTGPKQETLGTVSTVSLHQSGMRERKDRRGSPAFIGCAVEITVDAPATIAGAVAEVDATGSGHSGWCTGVQAMEGKPVRLKLTSRQMAELFKTRHARISPKQVKF